MCGGKSKAVFVKKNSVLLVHVVGAAPSSALRNSSAFAIQLVQDFFRKYTKFDPERVIELSNRFQRLEVDSRLEIAFEGKPKVFVVPSYRVYNHRSQDGLVISELETRVVSRYIRPDEEYKDFEIERTDFFKFYFEDVDTGDSSSSRSLERGPTRRISYETQPAVENHYQVPRSTGKKRDNNCE